MCHARRGRCVIFNMEKVGAFPDRRGTMADGRLLMELFKQLNFEVEHLLNYTVQVRFCPLCSLLIVEPLYFYHFLPFSLEFD